MAGAVLATFVAMVAGWYLSVASVGIQAVLILLLMQREFGIRLSFAPAPPAVAVHDEPSVAAG